MARQNRRRRRSPFLGQAAAETLVRYGPEIAGLQELQRSARQTYRGDVRAAHAGATGITSAVKVATPEMRRTYRQSARDEARAAAVTNQDVAGLPGTSNSVKAAISLEQGGFKQQLAGERAGALGELAQRGVDARAGEAFQVKAARRNYRQDLASILARKRSLAKEAGTFEAQTLYNLGQDQAARDLRLRIANIGARTSRLNALLSAETQQRGQDLSAATQQRGQDLARQSQREAHRIAQENADTSRRRAVAAVRAQRHASPIERQKALKAVNRIGLAATLVGRYQGLTVKGANGRPRRPTPAEVTARMIDEGYSQVEIDLAYNLRRNGGKFSRKGARIFRGRIGYRVPAPWRARPRRPGSTTGRAARETARANAGAYGGA